MKRPAPYVPLSVTFSSSKTGTAIQAAFGAEGLGVWCAILAAGKRGQGQVVLANDSDWATLGILTPPRFKLIELLKLTGRMKQTRTTRHGHVLYVTLTRYGQWNDDARRAFERERKSRTEAQSHRKKTGNAPEKNRKDFALEGEGERELEEEGEVVRPSENGTPELELPFAQELELQKLLEVVTDKDDWTAITLRKYASRLPQSAIAKVRESSVGKTAAYACAALKSEITELGAA